MLSLTNIIGSSSQGQLAYQACHSSSVERSGGLTARGLTLSPTWSYLCAKSYPENVIGQPESQILRPYHELATECGVNCCSTALTIAMAVWTGPFARHRLRAFWKLEGSQLLVLVVWLDFEWCQLSGSFIARPSVCSFTRRPVFPVVDLPLSPYRATLHHLHLLHQMMYHPLPFAPRWVTVLFCCSSVIFSWELFSGILSQQEPLDRWDLGPKPLDEKLLEWNPAAISSSLGQLPQTAHDAGHLHRQHPTGYPICSAPGF